jgi:hypothetical protein
MTLKDFVLNWTALARYRKALDDIYNSGKEGRKLVIKHFGLWHPKTTSKNEKKLD